MKKGICIVVLTGLLLALTACSLDIPTKSAEEDPDKTPARTKASADSTLPYSEPGSSEEGTEAESRVTEPVTGERDTPPAESSAAKETAAEAEMTPEAAAQEPETSPAAETTAVPGTTPEAETTAEPETTPQEAAPEETVPPAAEETTAVPETTTEEETSKAETTAAAETEPAVSVKPGDMISFGTYEQDGIASNGPEEIRWIVLSVDGEKALLLARYCLDCRVFHEKDANVTWENADLRKWLGGSFFQRAFTVEEQEKILSVRLTNPANPLSGAGAAGETEDKAFLLSIEEVEAYLTGELYDFRGTTPTRYAMDHGSTLASNGNTWWWLRTNGKDLKSFAEVFSYREIDYMGDPAVNPEQAVRPAIWLDLHGFVTD